MSSYRNKIWEEALLPFEVIEAVVNGDVEACQEVLMSFKNYTDKICKAPVDSVNGTKFMELDLSMKQAVEQKLLYAITNKFEMLPLE
ncbi:MAG: helix-turn-helix domain-containing protein [Mobilitalea sp.]